MNNALMSKMMWKVAMDLENPWVVTVKAKNLPFSAFLDDLNPRLVSTF